IGRIGGLRLRALPAGDSITFGLQSSTGNGYRYPLQKVIMSPPWISGLASRQNSANDTIVDFIGSVDSGTMPDSDNEGHSGAEIDAIGDFLFPYLAQNPNVIFLLAGTNDINNGNDVDNAPARLMAVVDWITSTLPTAAVLVGTIPMNGDPTKEALADAFNHYILGLPRPTPWPRPSANLGQSLGSAYLGPEDMADSLHPNDQGCQKMADVWFGALWQAAEWGWIEPATGVLPEGPTRCSCSFTEPNKPIEVLPVPPSGNCTDLNDNSTAVRFADLNGDGRAEYLWLDGNGATTAFLNLGSTQSGINAGQVQWLGSGLIATGVSALRHQVQFADLNGDGRAEYLWVHDDGSVDAWLNLGGPDNGPDAANVAWFPSGSIASGIGKDGTGMRLQVTHLFLYRLGVRFADLNGDGRAEYLYLDKNGAMTAFTHTGGVIELWINEGGPDDGPNAAKVTWLPQGIIATGVGSSGVGVQFADLNGDGRAEYLDVDYPSSAVNAWLNGCP
ncbi:SGNH hydrolase-type esterase domain-containing protein, partial [Mycena capillaripes]